LPPTSEEAQNTRTSCPRATLSDVLGLRPDVVILATGSTPDWPKCLPEAYRGEGIVHDLRETVTQLLQRRATSRVRESGTAVIYDHDHSAFTYAAVELLAARFSRVVIITPRAALAEEEPLVNRLAIQRRLYRLGVEVLALSEPLVDDAFADGVVRAKNIFNGREMRIDDVALFSYATPRRPDDALSEPLRAAGLEVQLVGDCYAPRSVLAATSDGHRIGNLI
jgi:hypothetical protein